MGFLVRVLELQVSRMCRVRGVGTFSMGPNMSHAGF